MIWFSLYNCLFIYFGCLSTLFGLFNNLVFLHLVVSINWLVCFYSFALSAFFIYWCSSIISNKANLSFFLTLLEHYWFTPVQTVQSFHICRIRTDTRSIVCFAYDSSSSLGGCVFLCITHSPNTSESCALGGQTQPCWWWVWNSPCLKYCV